MYRNYDRIAQMIQKEICEEHIAGAQIAIFHKNKEVYADQFGMADREAGIAMDGSQIFRLFSMTKPVTAVALMILLERGLIELHYPIKWFLPTFSDPLVAESDGTLRPAARDITIRDLIHMTSGIVYPDDTPAGREMGGVWWRQTERYLNGEKMISTKDMVLEMGRCPLAFDPGERWQYGSSADVCGALIEVISGMRLGEFMKKEIFDPLGMKDTGFYVKEEAHHRLAQVYEWSPEGIRPYTGNNLCMTDYKKDPGFEAGGSGLVSTISDYSKFARMLANGGEYDGVRILGRKSVEMLCQDGLNADQRESLNWESMRGMGYGWFMRNLRNPSEAGFLGSVGEFGWDGWLGCNVIIDPKEELVFLYFIQQTNTGNTDFVRKLCNVVWGGIE